MEWLTSLGFWEEVLQWLAIGFLLGRVAGVRMRREPPQQIKPRDWGSPL